MRLPTFLVAVLLFTANAHAFDFVNDILYEYGFVLKRIEEKIELEPTDNPFRTTALSGPKKDQPPLPPPLPPVTPNIPIPDADPVPPPPAPTQQCPPGCDDCPIEGCQDRIIPGPPVDPPLPTCKPATGSNYKPFVTSAGKTIQVPADKVWKEFPNGDIRGCAPGMKVVFSPRQNEYYEVDPAFRWWDTEAGLISTSKGNRLVRMPFSNTYYEVPDGPAVQYSTPTYSSAPSRGPCANGQCPW